MRAIDVTQWNRREHSDGTIVLTAPPVHAAFARERHAQLRIRRGVPLARLDHFRERFTTRAGDLATLHVVDERDGLRATSCIVGDDSMTTIEGRDRSPNIVDVVRELALDHAWTSGAARIRMLPCRAPRDWFGVRRTFATCWLARDRAVLVVGDAVPRGRAERTYDHVWPGRAGSREPLAGCALPATLARDPHGAEVELADARWRIRIALTGASEHVATLVELARSIEPPP